MTEYPHAFVSEAIRFFTVNLAERKNNRLLVDEIDWQRSAFTYTRRRHPFQVEAMVILPDYLQGAWTLPPGDTDFSTRWNLLTGYFSRSI